MATKGPELNPRGIPAAPFVSKVDDFVGGKDTTDIVLRKFDDMLASYKIMENSKLQRKKVVEDKIPELRKALGVIEAILTKKAAEETMDVHFELSESLHAKARIENMEKVCLWLGANVMLEYTIEEARKLLAEKLEIAESQSITLGEDLEYLRLQITTMEVNMARVYNWDVKQRKIKA